MRWIKAAAVSLWTTLVTVCGLSVIALALAVQLFGIRVGGAIALYFVVWWTLLFVVLPFGVRSQAETGEVVAGSEPGAPAMPALREKAIWTTIVSAAVFLAAVGLLPLSGL
jgi:predicted secreted protein